MGDLFLLSALVFLPAVGALVLAALRNDEVIRLVTLGITVVVFFLSIVAMVQFKTDEPGVSEYMQSTFNVAWILNKKRRGSLLRAPPFDLS